MAEQAFVSPAPFWVYVTVAPTEKNWLKKPHTSRVGACRTEAEIAPMIAEDLKSMSNSFGGLIETPGTEGRTYRAFRAEWTELKL